MSLDNSNQIDSLGVKDKELVMLIYDNDTWDEETAHFKRLENKINSYLTYIDSGQYQKNYKDIIRFNIVILYLHGLTENALHFMNNVNASFRQNNDPVRLTYDLPDVDRVIQSRDL